MPPYNPDDWMDLLGLAILGVPTIAAAYFANKARQDVKSVKDDQDTKHQENKELAETTLYAVTNNHSTHVRDDIDEIRNLVRDGFAETKRDIGGIREELRTERIERIEGDRLRITYGGGQQ